MLRVLAMAGALCLAVAQSASATDEISDPCGLGTAVVDASYELEPVLPWLDICGVDVSGVEGEGPLRAVESVLRLDGNVASGAESGVSYDARFRTEHCSVWQAYAFYPGLGQGTTTRVEAYCDYRETPCDWPESEVPNIHCGEVDEIRLLDTPAVEGEVDGDTVTITFDPNKLPAGSLLSGLRRDLAPEGEPPNEIHYRPLTAAWVQTLLYNGVRGLTSSYIGPGGDYAWRDGPLSLGGPE